MRVMGSPTSQMFGQQRVKTSNYGKTRLRIICEVTSGLASQMNSNGEGISIWRHHG